MENQHKQRRRYPSFDERMRARDAELAKLPKSLFDLPVTNQRVFTTIDKKYGVWR